jgi:rRNA maturation protein Nop10
MTAEPCPVCGSQAVNTVGPVYGGTKRTLWRRRSFEEALYRCAEGHVYAVRTEGGSVTTEAYDSIDDWLVRKTGTERPERPPGF